MMLFCVSARQMVFPVWIWVISFGFIRSDQTEHVPVQVPKLKGTKVPVSSLKKPDSNRQSGGDMAVQLAQFRKREISLASMPHVLEKDSNKWQRAGQQKKMDVRRQRPDDRMPKRTPRTSSPPQPLPNLASFSNRSRDDFIFAKLLQRCHGRAHGGSNNHPQAKCPQGKHWAKGELWKVWCMQSKACIPKATCHHLIKRIGGSDWDVCMDGIDVANGKCLVYSVGVAGHYQFDKAMGALGCEVHSFDPTVNHPRNLAPNVTFHHWGLYGGDKHGASATFKHKVYGKIAGKMVTIDEMIEKLGHTEREISVFKMDCEGCEWEVFGGIMTNTTRVKQIRQILTELHFSKPLQVQNNAKLPDLIRTYDALFKSNGTLSYFQQFAYAHNYGVPGDRQLVKELYDIGLPYESCCREVGFIRSNGSLVY